MSEIAFSGFLQDFVGKMDYSVSDSCLVFEKQVDSKYFKAWSLRICHAVLYNLAFLFQQESISRQTLFPPQGFDSMAPVYAN